MKKLEEIYEMMKSFKSASFEIDELKEILEVSSDEPVELAYAYNIELTKTLI